MNNLWVFSTVLKLWKNILRISFKYYNTYQIDIKRPQCLIQYFIYTPWVRYSIQSVIFSSKKADIKSSPRGNVLWIIFQSLRPFENSIKFALSQDVVKIGKQRRIAVPAIISLTVLTSYAVYNFKYVLHLIKVFIEY